MKTQWSKHSRRSLVLHGLAILMLCFCRSSAFGQSDSVPSVGMSGKLEQVVLPGTKLQVKPYDSKTPMVVRIVGAWPHGSDWRYDIEYHGLEPGSYNLVDYLQREDGSTTDNIQALPVQIGSLLPEGQIVPNQLETGLIPRLGGYRFLAAVVVTLWVLVLGVIIFYRGKSKAAESVQAQPLTLIDYLKPRLQAGIDGKLHRSQFAELERMIFAYWRMQLGLENIEAKDAMEQVKQHEDAGPMLTRIEQVMHDPRQAQQIDLASILEPYRDVTETAPIAGTTAAASDPRSITESQG